MLTVGLRSGLVATLTVGTLTALPGSALAEPGGQRGALSRRERIERVRTSFRESSAWKSAQKWRPEENQPDPDRAEHWAWRHAKREIFDYFRIHASSPQHPGRWMSKDGVFAALLAAAPGVQGVMGVMVRTGRGWEPRVLTVEYSRGWGGWWGNGQIWIQAQTKRGPFAEAVTVDDSAWFQALWSHVYADVLIRLDTPFAARIRPSKRSLLGPMRRLTAPPTMLWGIPPLLYAVLIDRRGRRAPVDHMALVLDRAGFQRAFRGRFQDTTVGGLARHLWRRKKGMAGIVEVVRSEPHRPRVEYLNVAVRGGAVLYLDRDLYYRDPVDLDRHVLSYLSTDGEMTVDTPALQLEDEVPDREWLPVRTVQEALRYFVHGQDQSARIQIEPKQGSWWYAWLFRRILSLWRDSNGQIEVESYNPQTWTWDKWYLRRGVARDFPNLTNLADFPDFPATDYAVFVAYYRS